jgi:hypothetical protein
MITRSNDKPQLITRWSYCCCWPHLWMKAGQPDKREKRASDWLQDARQHHLQERELRLSVRQCPILYPCNKEKMRLEGYQCPSWVRKHIDCTLIVMKYKNALASNRHTFLCVWHARKISYPQEDVPSLMAVTSQARRSVKRSSRSKRSNVGRKPEAASIRLSTIASNNSVLCNSRR